MTLTLNEMNEFEVMTTEGPLGLLDFFNEAVEDDPRVRSKIQLDAGLDHPNLFPYKHKGKLYNPALKPILIALLNMGYAIQLEKL